MEQQRAENRLILAYLYVALVSVFIGTFFGLLQVTSRAGLFQTPSWFDYYRMLTAHGVLLALVFTTLFISGLSTYATYRSIERPQRSLALGWAAWWMMTVGTAMAAFEILAGNASVLYTFYAPLKASPWFYVGAALLIVGTWGVLLDVLLSISYFRRTHPGARIPLPVFMVVANYLMWFLATIGVAIEVLFQLIPWSFGWVPGIDVQLSRTLFWYFGHPLVYFWLLGAYLIWYGVVPKILGVPIFSDALTRVAFILFIILSLPVGVHHQFTDPGISHVWKELQTGFTLMVVIPSLMTAFALFATFEQAAAKQGRHGFIGIVAALPWRHPTFLGSVLGMILFIFGGFGGIVNASYSLDVLTHNTMWIVGHFHITVGGPVALTLIAATYTLIPALTGRRFTSEGLARTQIWLWFIGLSIMSFAMHTAGLLGAPRREAALAYGGNAIAAQWAPWTMLAAVGGIIVFASVICYLIAFVQMAFGGERGETRFEFADPDLHAEKTPAVLDRLGLWTAAAMIMVIIAYTGPITEHFHYHIYLAPGMRTW